MALCVSPQSKLPDCAKPVQTFEVNELLPTAIPRTMIPSFETGNVTSEEDDAVGESNSHLSSWISNPIGEKEDLRSFDADTTASIGPKTKTII